MIQTTLPESLTHENRWFIYLPVRAELFSAVLLIGQDNERDVYAVAETEFDPLFRRTFLIAKAKGSAGVYCVTVSELPSQPGHCTCTGYGRWTNCKHLDSLEKLVQVYRIPIT